MSDLIKKLESYILHAAELKGNRISKIPPAYIWMQEAHSPLDEIYTDGTLDALTRPLNFNLSHTLTPDSADDWYGLCGRHVIAASLKDVRGIPLRPFPRHVLRVKLWGASAEDKQSVELYDIKAVSPNGENWKFYLKDRELPKEKESENIEYTIKASIGLQCFAEYCWHVDIFFESGSVGIRIPVNDESLAEIAKLRDLPEGKRRMDSLLHTVASHRRHLKSGMTTTVNRHLRGAVEHVWQGCRLRVLPAVNDVDKMKLSSKVQAVKNALAEK